MSSLTLELLIITFPSHTKHPGFVWFIGYLTLDISFITSETLYGTLDLPEEM